MDEIGDEKYGEFVRRRRKELKITQGELAKRLNLSTDFISRIEKGERTPSVRTKCALDVFFNTASILGGDEASGYFGPLQKSVSKIAGHKKIVSDEMVEKGKILKEKAQLEREEIFLNTQDICTIVDIYNMVEGGPGAEPIWHEPVDRRAIPVRYLRQGIRPVLVRGRSMEPTFKNGAIIGVDQNDKYVIEGEAYAVVLPYSGAAVKRLYPLPDGVLIRSDNKEFPEVKLMKDEIPDYFILGRVCWVIQEV